MSERKTILVSGDCICDHNFYKGNRSSADSSQTRGFRVTERCGGALLLKELIAKTMRDMKGWRTDFGICPDFEALPSNYHAFCFWEPQVANPEEKDPQKQREVWRASEPPLGYGHSGDDAPVGACGNECGTKIRMRNESLSASPEVVVIDDAGLGFRDLASEEQWPLAHKKDPRWVVMKLMGSIGEGDLWKEVIARCKRNLVLVVSADQLRCAGVRISRGLSWEATSEDLAAELNDNPALTPLLAARHLIVTFRSDGAFWLDNAAPLSRKSILVFDSKHAEGEWSEQQGKGTTFGFMSCFVAAVVRELCRTEGEATPDFESALIAGLSASRVLRSVGHGPVKIPDPKDSKKQIDNPKPGFPFDDIVATILQPTKDFVSALIPQGERKRGDWMMLDEWQVLARRKNEPRPHYEAALAVAVLGPEVLERFPVAQFGNYQTVDRKEIESLRTIRQLITNYTKVERQKTPLNLGVFGPPGSGKSFIVTEIAKAAGIKEEDVKLFNLSQFSKAEDIIGAFHQVRDKILKGSTPLIFWDEFDAQEYKWLQYLLAPMEDGEFQDGQITHPVGKCIFVFAGATSASYEKFGPCNPDLLQKEELALLSKEKPDQLREVERLWRQFVLAKGPDFKSRLVSYLNLLGMNRRQVCVEEEGRRRWEDDESDLCYPIRRAFFIRSNFKCKQGERLSIDPGVLRALLEIPKYKSAGRSVQVLCNHLRGSSSGRAGRSGLPGYELLSMHVEADDFWKLCEQDMGFIPKAKELAVWLHEAYRIRIKGRKDKKKLNVPFARLSVDMQNANIAQALRIPGILRLAKMHLETGQTPVPLSGLAIARHATEELIRMLLSDADNLELLSEAEHNGWMVERMLSGWKFGRKKDDDKKHHDCLIPYSQLSEDTKNYDRWTIVGKKAPDGEPHLEQFGYVDIVKTVGLRVVMD